ncbi:DnaA regulatory inactivator Hda [Aromatoleum petrolei]|uniref:DnaA regulatory inactivator Hda n=1 Tax=Aromatoleum petrolei TaxID=76116 RepID=A0ABX1MT50_9RHOO|nr:DnaA regulatory inactivator Hda [Aromatoleum petrolei]NMF91130.1 DnaA regulatory inactivator Hda [Aromatoleum petrolei]QTQ35570.1 DnaA regulatory inactivator Hda [Aromatoleum petrolei]
MKQLVLDIRPDAPPTLDNFVVGGNEELVAALAAIAASAGASQPGHLYLWGPTGSGRSHLLRGTLAAAGDRPTACIAAAEAGHELPQTPGLLLAVDDVDRLDDAAQIALFNAFNRSRSLGQTLLLAGKEAPRQLALREDLRTRIGQCLIYEVRPLDDESRTAILATLAARRGLRLADEVIDFLMRHGRRDLPSLLAVLDALDNASLERKRAVTLPLLREMMQAGLEI